MKKTPMPYLIALIVSLFASSCADKELKVGNKIGGLSIDAPFISASNKNVKDIELNFSNNDGLSVVVEKKKDGADYTQLTILGESQKIYLDTATEADTTYLYRARSFNTKGDVSSWSLEVLIKSGSVAAIPPDKPGALMVTVLDDKSFNVTLPSFAGTVTKRELTVTNLANQNAKTVEVALNAANPYKVENGGVFTIDPDTNYRFVLKVYNAAGLSATSDPVEAKTMASTPPPTAPLAPSLNQLTLGTGTASIAWAAAGSGTAATSFQVQYCNSQANCDANTFMTVTTVPASTTTYMHDISGVTNGTTIGYRIVAVANNMNSGPSNKLTILVTIASNPPMTPSMTSLSLANSIATVKYSPSSSGGAPTSYKIFRCINCDSSTPTSAYTNIASATSTTYDDSTIASSGIMNGQTFGYRVSAVNSSGESAISSGLYLVYSPNPPPSAPILTQVTRLTSSTASVAWMPNPSSPPITQYIVKRYVGTTECAMAPAASFVQIASFPVGITSFTDGIANTTGLFICYKVIANNNYGSSPDSNVLGFLNIPPI